MFVYKYIYIYAIPIHGVGGVEAVVAETVGEGSQRTRAQISTTASLTLSHSFARSLSLTISSYNIILSLTTMRV